MTQLLVIDDEFGSVRSGERGTFSPDRALKVLGDKWGLLVLSRALHGAAGVQEFRQELSIPDRILSVRLERLVSVGLLERLEAKRAHGDVRFAVTKTGRALEQAVAALTAWTESQSDGSPARSTGRRDEAGDGVSVAVPPENAAMTLELLGTFAVRMDGEEAAALSTGSQRLLAFLALADRPVARSAIAGRMWPEVSEENAAISLRSALSRFDAVSREAITSTSTGLSLAPGVDVDIRRARDLARRLVEPGATITEEDLSGRATAALSEDILPDWYDEWVIVEAEDWRQLRIAALEAQSALLVEAGRLAPAACAARAAMRADPLRESATASLMRVHLAAGNQAEALRVYDTYRDLLDDALGIEPSRMLTALLEALRRRRHLQQAR